MKKTLKITCILLALCLLCSCGTPNGTVQGTSEPKPDNTHSSSTSSSNSGNNISSIDNDFHDVSGISVSENPDAPFCTYNEYNNIFDVINGNADIPYGTFPPEASYADGSMTVISLNGLMPSNSTVFPSTVITTGSTEYNISSGKLIISENGTTVSETSVFTDSYTIGGETDNEQEFAYGYENASSVCVIGTKLAVVTSSYDYTESYDEAAKDWIYGNKRASNVYIYDISDIHSPQFITKLSQDGELASYVFSGEHLYIVSSWFANKIDKDNIHTYIPHTYGDTANPINPEDIYVFEYSTCSGYTIITEYDIENSTIVDSSAVLGGSGRLYIDESDIYAIFFSEIAELSASYTEDSSDVEEYSEHCMSAIINFPTADISSPNFALVNGCFGNNFSIYTKDNILYFCAVAETSTYAVYTDTSNGWTSKKDISAQVENVLYSFSSDLAEINSAYLPNEEISSARFEENTVWVGFYSGEQGFDIHTGENLSSENG